MKKQSNWSILGYLLGITIILTGLTKYFILSGEYYDSVQVFRLGVSIAIGSLIIAVAWFYNKQQEISNTLTSVEDKISDFQDFFDELNQAKQVIVKNIRDNFVKREGLEI